MASLHPVQNLWYEEQMVTESVSLHTYEKSLLRIWLNQSRPQGRAHMHGWATFERRQAGLIKGSCLLPSPWAASKQNQPNWDPHLEDSIQVTSRSHSYSPLLCVGMWDTWVFTGACCDLLSVSWRWKDAGMCSWRLERGDVLGTEIHGTGWDMEPNDLVFLVLSLAPMIWGRPVPEKTLLHLSRSEPCAILAFSSCSAFGI